MDNHARIAAVFSALLAEAAASVLFNMLMEEQNGL